MRLEAYRRDVQLEFLVFKTGASSDKQPFPCTHTLSLRPFISFVFTISFNNVNKTCSRRRC